MSTKSFLLTESPPLAKLILGMSCFAMTSFESKDLISRYRDDTLRQTLLLANSMQGDELMQFLTRFSTCRFFAVFAEAASQTRRMHSLKVIQNIWVNLRKREYLYLLCDLRARLEIQNFHGSKNFYASNVIHRKCYTSIDERVVFMNGILWRSRQKVFVVLHLSASETKCHVSAFCYCLYVRCWMFEAAPEAKH